MCLTMSRRVTPTKVDTTTAKTTVASTGKVRQPNARPALQDFQLNPCTSRDGLQLAEEASPAGSSRPGPAPPAESEAGRGKTQQKGQKNIGDFFRRNRCQPAEANGADALARGDIDSGVRGELSLPLTLFTPQSCRSFLTIHKKIIKVFNADLIAESLLHCKLAGAHASHGR